MNRLLSHGYILIDFETPHATTFLNCKSNHKWPCHKGCILVKWQVDINHTLMWLPFQLDAT
jgi:hypothetical protein